MKVDEEQFSAALAVVRGGVELMRCLHYETAAYTLARVSDLEVAVRVFRDLVLAEKVRAGETT